MSVPVQIAAQRRILFVSGKGGVGKTAVSQAIALTKAREGHKTLWITFEDPFLPRGQIRATAPNLFHLNCVADIAFEEYAALKVGSARLVKLFLQNPVIRYLSKAAPGIHELVLLGKVWYERQHFDSIVVDLPSTGHGLAMFQSTKNFSSLFTGGPLQHDADAMIKTLGDPAVTAHLILAIPEEMPLVEALELNALLKGMFPQPMIAFLANRLFPSENISPGPSNNEPPHTPLSSTVADYVRRRTLLEEDNLNLWRSENVPFGTLPFIAPPASDTPSDWLPQALAVEWEKRGYA